MDENPALQALTDALNENDRHFRTLLKPATDILTELLSQIPDLPRPDVHAEHGDCTLQWNIAGRCHRPLTVMAHREGYILLTLRDPGGGLATVCEATTGTPGWINIVHVFISIALPLPAEAETESKPAVRFNADLLRQLADAYPDQRDTAHEQARLALLPQADDGCPYCARRCNDPDCQPGADCGSQCGCRDD